MERVRGHVSDRSTPDCWFRWNSNKLLYLALVRKRAEMDSIFEEDADEVGGEIEAYCPSPRCKADTTHTIISMYEDEVRRVQCVVCGEVHAYRKPRGDGVEGDGEGASKKSGSRRLSWDEAMGRASDPDLANCRPYSIRDTYEDGDVVHH